jgi:hypothetical protein
MDTNIKILILGLSKEKILEMKRSIKERAEQEYKKNVGFDQSTRK